MTQSFALKFISGKYQGGEFPLLTNREIVVGRASDLDMVLVEDMVSRKHAKITTGAGAVIIQDLGSTNGTFVNGEKIKKTRLKEGDRILIGTSILKVLLKEGPAQQRDEVDAKANLEALERSSAMEEVQKSEMTGQLDEVPIPDLLQLFATSKRTGVLSVHGSRLGKVYLRDGNVFYASIDDDHDMGPMKALCRMVGWDKGKFEFGPPEPSSDFVLELEDDTETLLGDANRQLDEYRAVAADLPPTDAKLRIPKPLEPALSQLEPADLDVFQLALNHSTVGNVLDRSATMDAETARSLLALIGQGFLIPR